MPSQEATYWRIMLYFFGFIHTAIVAIFWQLRLVQCNVRFIVKAAATPVKKEEGKEGFQTVTLPANCRASAQQSTDRDKE